jgi:L-iditol 2-dehydrogenase
MNERATTKEEAQVPQPGALMTAVVLTGPGAFELRQVPVPEPAPDEVLVRVRATSICGSDPKVVHGSIPGWPPAYPFIAGHEWAGQIVRVGSGVSNWAAGDRIVGEPHKGCGECRPCLSGHYNLCANYGKPETGHRHYGFKSQGSYAEYMVASSKSLFRLPDNVGYTEATMVGSAGVGLHGLKLAGVEPACTAVVIGPGAIGLCVIQLLKAMGAIRVIAVGRKGARLAMAPELGADETVDVLEGGASEKVLAMTGGRGADITVETSAAPDGPANAIHMTRFGGKVVLIGFYVPKDVTLPLQDVVYKEQTLYGVKADPNVYHEVLAFLAAGKLKLKPLVSHVFPLRDFATALDTFEHRKGGAMKVVVES